MREKIDSMNSVMDPAGVRRISAEELETVLGTRFSSVIRALVDESDLRYELLQPDERDAYLLDVIETLMRSDHVVSGEHRRPDWEAGWSENLNQFRATGDLSCLVPRYHSKHILVRWRQQIVKPLSRNFDYEIHRILVDWCIDEYMRKADAIFEFGCGPAYHLLRARSYNAGARLVGMDWTVASQEIIAEVVRRGIDTNAEGRHLDFLKPDYSIGIPSNSAIYTVAALEQLGPRFDNFLDFLLDKKPAICVHLEPIDEVMDSHQILDRLSVLYSRKRNYLTGFLTRLRSLEQEGKITIHKVQRTYTGSYFLEGHTLVVWSPR